MTGRLSGRLIAVTAAARGIGAAIAGAFRAEGADLFLIDKDAESLEALRHLLLQAPGGLLLTAVADVTDTQKITSVFEHARTQTDRPFDGLVNNVGVNVFHTPLETTQSEWQRAFAVNLEGAWSCASAVLPGMIETGHGVILNIVSTHAFTIIRGTFPYPVVKHALLGLTRSLAIEYADKGIRVNALAPGYIETQTVIDWWKDQGDAEKAKERTISLHPQGRIGTPEEIAKAAIFMISDECPFMTATCLTIDGGLSVLQHQ